MTRSIDDIDEVGFFSIGTERIVIYEINGWLEAVPEKGSTEESE
jgi:hypothetical protein